MYYRYSAMLVKFVKGYSPYQKGESAGFPPDKAEKLVKMGVAIYPPRPKPVSEPEPRPVVPELNPEPETTDFQAPINRMMKKAKKK